MTSSHSIGCPIGWLFEGLDPQNFKVFYNQNEGHLGSR